MININELTLDIFYLFAVTFADVLRLAAAAFIVASVLYAMIIVTVFIIRNE